jgi:ankyrin repeat protein
MKIFTVYEMLITYSVKEILESGININMASKNGWSFLHIACKSNNTNTVKELIENGANINSVTKYGLTPLHTACSYGYKDLLYSSLKTEQTSTLLIC